VQPGNFAAKVQLPTYFSSVGIASCTFAVQVTFDCGINPVVRGWMRYQGAVYRSALRSLRRVDAYLPRLLRKRYKQLGQFKKVEACAYGAPIPRLFAERESTPTLRCSG
jgi:hypothetical protein